MDHPQALRLLIRQKLADGRLPWDSTPRVWGGPGNGEVCDGCDQATERGDLLMEGVTSASGSKKGIQFHVKCFYLWETERKAGRADERQSAASSGPLRPSTPETVCTKISGHQTRAMLDHYNITSDQDLRGRPRPQGTIWAQLACQGGSAESASSE